MDWKLELVVLPVSEVDRTKAFYTEKVGFDADHDTKVSDEIRVVQLTPPGSACSIAFGTGIVDTPPGSVQALHLVVSDINAARAELVEWGGGRRGPGSRGGLVRFLQRPGRERLGLAAAALLVKRGIGDAVEPRAPGCLKICPGSARLAPAEPAQRRRPCVSAAHPATGTMKGGMIRGKAVANSLCRWMVHRWAVRRL